MKKIEIKFLTTEGFKYDIMQCNTSTEFTVEDAVYHFDKHWHPEWLVENYKEVK